MTQPWRLQRASYACHLVISYDSTHKMDFTSNMKDADLADTVDDQPRRPPGVARPEPAVHVGKRLMGLRAGSSR